MNRATIQTEARITSAAWDISMQDGGVPSLCFSLDAVDEAGNSYDIISIWDGGEAITGHARTLQGLFPIEHIQDFTYQSLAAEPLIGRTISFAAELRPSESGPQVIAQRRILPSTLRLVARDA